MSISEISNHDWDDGYTGEPVDVDDTQADWRQQLPEFLQKLYESLDPDVRTLIEQRLDLQPMLAASSKEIRDADGEHRRLSDQNSVHHNVDLAELFTAAGRSSAAGKTYSELIGRLIELETGLCEAGVQSYPFLWVTQRRNGQALD